MGTLISLQRRLGSIRFVSHCLYFGNQRIQVADLEGRVGLARRFKIRLYSKMELDTMRLEPGAATLRKLSRLGNFCKSKDIHIKCTRLIFLPGRHGKLDVIDGEDGHHLFSKTEYSASTMCMCYGSTG